MNKHKPDPVWGRPGKDHTGAARRRGQVRWQGPRWVVPVRAIVVVLAMVAAALGVLWIESAGVQNATAQLSAETAGKVAVPPLEPGDRITSASPGSPASATGKAPPTGSAPPTSTSGPADEPPGASASAGTAAGTLVVHVAGAVKHPGVFMVHDGSRVFEAVNAAGGALPTAELSALNLAAPVGDGVQIFVPTKEQAAKMLAGPGSVLQPSSPGQLPGAANNSSGGAVAGLVNLNTASVAELDTLPGVGPVLAERIVAWRTEHGPFATVDALDAVAGIGAKLMSGLHDLVTVS